MVTGLEASKVRVEVVDPSELREPYQPSSYMQQARRILKRLILNGTYQPGERIKEAEVARTLGMSRGPVREAVLNLANEGLLELYPQRGAFVREFDIQEIRDLWEVRGILETRAARLAAKRAGEEDLVRLKDHYDNLERALAKSGADPQNIGERTPWDLYTEVFNLHEQLSMLAKNESLTHYLREINTQLELARSRAAIAPGRPRETRMEHLAIYEAIANRDPEAAEQAMQAHIRNGLHSLERSFGEGEAPS